MPDLILNPTGDPAITIINNALIRGEELTEQARRVSQDVMSASRGITAAPAPYVGTTPGLRFQPPAFSPNTDLSVDFANAYQEAFNDFDPKVLEAVVDYLARFFPATLAQVCDDWIQNAIVNGGTGIPPAIENAIWERARGREIVEATRMEQEATAQFAARGWPMPSGALAARLLVVQQDAANKSATINRDVAIKQAEIEIETVKFAIEQGLRVRLAVIQGVGDYIRAWLKPAEEAVDYAQALVNAREKLWNEAANYYRAMVDEARLNLEAQGLSQRSYDTMGVQGTNLFMQSVEIQTKAAMSMATMLGQMAAGALNAITSGASKSTQLVGSAPVQ